MTTPSPIQKHIDHYENFKKECLLAGRNLSDIPILWLAYRVHFVEKAIYASSE